MTNLFTELKKDSEKLNHKTTMLTAIVFSAFFVGFVILNLALKKYDLVVVQGGVALSIMLCVLFYRITKLFSATMIGILTTLSALMGYYMVTGGSEGFHVGGSQQTTPLKKEQNHFSFTHLHLWL